MSARTNLADRIQRLRVFVNLYTARQMVQRAQLIGIHHEFLERGDQPAFQPATGVEHKVHPRQKPHVQTVRRLIGCLRVGQF